MAASNKWSAVFSKLTWDKEGWQEREGDQGEQD
jgi:hypothetical protein